MQLYNYNSSSLVTYFSIKAPSMGMRHWIVQQQVNKAKAQTPQAQDTGEVMKKEIIRMEVNKSI